MKLIYLVLLTPAIAYGQFFNESKVPTLARHTAERLYPRATAVEWSRSDAGYEAVIGKKTPTHLFFAVSGELLEEAKEIARQELPASIAHALHSLYSDYHFMNALCVKHGTEAAFNVQVGKAEDELDLVFDAKGQLRAIFPLPADEKSGN